MCSSDLIRASFPHGLTNVLKAIGARAGVRCGPSRLPLHTVPEEHLTAIFETADARASIQRLLA